MTEDEGRRIIKMASVQSRADHEKKFTVHLDWYLLVLVCALATVGLTLPRIVLSAYAPAPCRVRGLPGNVWFGK